MSIDKRSFKRMICESVVGIEDIQSKLRIINVSASGIAFQLFSEERDFGYEKKIIKVSLSFFGVEYKDLALRIERVESKEGKVIIAGVFVDISDKVRDEINALVESDGGYDSHDTEAKKKYFNAKLSWAENHG